MEPVKTRIAIGLDKPFYALHLSDAHLALADERDGERKMLLAEKRTREFDAHAGGAYKNLRMQLDYAREKKLPVLYTGDLIDFVSLKNLETAEELLSDMDYFMAAGNHEFSLYVGEAFEDKAYKMMSYALVEKYFRNDLYFASRIMGGINFVAVDNSYYLFEKRQLECLKAEVRRGVPIALMLHTPIHTNELYSFMTEERKYPCAYLAGTPEALMRQYDEYRFRQQRPNEETLEFIAYVQNEPLIRCIFSGHMHFNFETRLPGGCMQYVTGGGYRAKAREIEFY